MKAQTKVNNILTKQPKLTEAETDWGSRLFKYVTSKQFTFSLDDNKSRQFGVLFEILDMKDATGEPEYKDTPYLVGAYIMADKCDKRFYEGTGKADWFGTIIDCNQYMGGVPVDHILTEELGNANELFTQFNATEAVLATASENFGTYAAQHGKGEEFNYLKFRTIEAAERFVELLKARTPLLSNIIEMILDRPINMAGDTGYSVLAKQAGVK